jgi:hypothetical protein
MFSDLVKNDKPEEDPVPEDIDIIIQQPIIEKDCTDMVPLIEQWGVVDDALGLDEPRVKGQYKRLTEMKCSAENNEEYYKILVNDGMMDFDDFDGLYNQMNDLGDGENQDPYFLTGDMINAFMLTHPVLKDGWNNMTADERWIFTEAIYYGIGQFVNGPLYNERNMLGEKVKKYEEEVTPLLKEARDELINQREQIAKSAEEILTLQKDLMKAPSYEKFEALAKDNERLNSEIKKYRRWLKMTDGEEVG